ncbi:glucoamylase family protein [Paludicola sp. MB14-C6]|uniref:GH36-type glycosyl hydrolase domain-containing protein n=1 Tax=Paludihabitans sp. MB14-C6 TaxID=3070656 RepID=UPI0027DAF20A|nr:glucoamylase family protein [Paludicola sp. MB14-C6]WMJ23230.1 glucoamylase family protein [Paludicola sp. MB14-C6]
MEYLNQELQEKLKAYISEFIESKFISSKCLIKQVRSSRRTIRKYYNSLMPYSNTSGFERLFCDSYYKVERESHLILKRLKNVYLPASKGKCNIDLYGFFDCVLQSHCIINTDSIIDLIGLFEEKRYMKNVEFDFIEVILKCAAVNNIAELIKKKNFEYTLLDRCIGVIYASEQADYEYIIEKKNRLEYLLKQDPSGVYSKQSDVTQKHYRYIISKMARITLEDELLLTRQFLAKAKESECKKHIGFYIYEAYEIYKKNAYKRKLHLTLLYSLSIFLTVGISILFHTWYLIPLIFLPIIEIIRPMVECFILKGVEHDYAPRMDFHSIVPEECKTVVVVSTLMPEINELASFKTKLEHLILTNSKGAISFVVLLDYKPAKEQEMPLDSEKLNGLDKAVKEINRLYQNKLLAIVRKREYSQTQGVYTGRERKRGAICDLVSTIHGKDIKFAHTCGDLEILTDVKYLMALDYDTKLLLDSVCELVEIAAHPLNQPIVNYETKIVESGYGIILPHIVIDLKESMKTMFTRIMGGIGGNSCYDSGCSEFYQELYGNSVFTGKGLIDVNAFFQVMQNEFEPETVLSHDIIEGLALRVRHAGGVEVVDGFPYNATAYFKRLHRWIRGDFQNIAFLFRKRHEKNIGIQNHLKKIDRYKILDNIRREITPIFSIVCLIISCFVDFQISIFLFLIAILAVTAPYLFAILVKLIHGSITAFTTRTYAKTLPITAELFTKAVAELILLPQYAYISLDAGIRGLYRRFISKKNMLEWVTAAQVQNQKHGITTELLYYYPCIILPVALLFAPYLYLKIAAIVFLLSVSFVLLSKKVFKDKPISITRHQQNVLVQDVKIMWDYYQDLCNEENHFLPPDNMQEAPVFRIAHRTSPTNIGMMLLSALTARDFDIITTDQLVFYVENVLATVDSLEKFHGNLFNWYDTMSLATLEPAFVSTVDSGNFICSLVCLKEGLKEYEFEHQNIRALIKKIESLIDDADLSVFYDKRRGLFTIGYDRTSDSFSLSHYDMLMSEARMTSYFAIAKGQVPKKHWGSLNRTLSRQGVHTGPMSWTGTMFEYFMPELLLHSVKGSFGYEALHYCIQCQKNRVKKYPIPYGISESGIYRFDNSLNYQYQANGVQRLGLKRGMNDELVISPYSSFLCLPQDFESAYHNIKLIESIQVKGKYGFYEAIDYTRKRIGDNSLRVIKSYMAHHIGMSIIAVNNLINNNIMQKRFLRDLDMSSAIELLQEKIQVGEIVFFEQRKREHQIVPEEIVHDYCEKLNPCNPKIKLLNNGELTSVITDIGASFIQYNSVDITRRPTDLLRAPLGTFAFLQTKDKILSLTYAPSYDSGCKYETEFTKYSTKFYCDYQSIKTEIEVTMHRVLPCEQRKIQIHNTEKGLLDTALIIYAEPCLFGFMDDITHKAFSKLFLNISIDKETNIIIASRKKRGSEAIVFMAIGFKEDISFDLESNRENIFTRGNLSSVKYCAFTDEFEGGTGVPDPCIALRVKVNCKPNDKAEYTLLTAIGKSKTEAIMHIKAVRECEGVKEQIAAKSELEHGTLTHRIAQVLLPQVIFQTNLSSSIINAISKNTLGVNGLWSMGISGDLPIVIVDVLNKNDMERVDVYSICHALFRLNGIQFDLIFLYQEDEEETETINAIQARVKMNCGESSIGQKGGIYLLKRMQIDEEHLNLLYATACHVATRSLVRIEIPTFPYQPVQIKSVQKQNLDCKCGYHVNGGVFIDNSFYVTETPKLPWCHILSNPTFGTLMSDKCLGFTWAINSRENKLTPWYNDTIRDNNGEMLCLNLDDHYFDLLDGSLVEYNPNYACYYGETPSFTSKVTVTVPRKGMIKYINVELQNHSEKAKTISLCYYTEPVLNVTRTNSRFINGGFEENILLFQNPFNLSGKAFVGMSCTEEVTSYFCDRPQFLCGRWEENSLPPKQDLCGALVITKEIKPNETLNLTFMLCFAMSKQGVIEQIRLQPHEAYFPENSIQVNSNEKAYDFMVNTWLPHQMLASRIYGRTGFYQCGGAYGFRDQLQDVFSYMPLSPTLTRTHIIRCCASQFEEGDVMHWWHIMPKSGGGKKGVRTRYSDDLVWLPYVVSQYLDFTNDQTLLDIPVKYLIAPELQPKQKDHYLEAEYTEYRESVYEHCKRALNKAYVLGNHGLPKIGCGDWNDGYSKVGIEGKGESVWLAQFLSLTMQQFKNVALLRNDTDFAEECETRSCALLQVVDQFCYDKDHYIRAFFDNGQVMGSYQSEECKIDSLTQSFSVLANMPNKERTLTALETAYHSLVDEEFGIIKLFTPPYDASEQDPGYVKAYPRGVRENGGQYTHASIWFAMAFAKMEQKERFFQLAKYLNPISKYENDPISDCYLNEPYYMSADIYTNEYSYGRGGWSLYTGAAGWYYQLLLQYYFGIHLNLKSIVFEPKLPFDSEGYHVNINMDGNKIETDISNYQKKNIQF